MKGSSRILSISRFTDQVLLCRESGAVETYSLVDECVRNSFQLIDDGSLVTAALPSSDGKKLLIAFLSPQRQKRKGGSKSCITLWDISQPEPTELLRFSVPSSVAIRSLRWCGHSPSGSFCAVSNSPPASAFSVFLYFMDIRQHLLSASSDTRSSALAHPPSFQLTAPSHILSLDCCPPNTISSSTTV
jgi:hypothetical protein